MVYIRLLQHCGVNIHTTVSLILLLIEAAIYTQD